MITAALLIATAALASPTFGQDTAHAVTRDGVTLPREIDVAGHHLVLNGTALRKKFIVKVYVAALYLPTKQSDAEQILVADEPRQVTLQFVHDVDKEKMCNAWNEALEKNTPDASQELKAQFQTLCSYMEDVKKGEGFVFTYLPGTGTEVSVRGASKGTIEGKPFADALFKAWIGPKPGPGEGFKKQLLGLS
ncbi:MAG TPA: chalcone isomerase family protein [Gemmatimonadales bacterium]|nr:chalcone isomerase family protein [Gemmatimonadales bacterium]